MLSHKTTTRDGVKTVKFQVKYQSGEVIKCNLDDLKIDAPFILANVSQTEKALFSYP